MESSRLKRNGLGSGAGRLVHTLNGRAHHLAVSPGAGRKRGHPWRIRVHGSALSPRLKVEPTRASLTSLSTPRPFPRGRTIDEPDR